MKNLFLTSAIAIFAFTGAAAAQQAKQDFTLVNKTGYELSHVYVSPTKSGEWEDDVLGRDTLDDGEYVAITFRRAVRSCYWDLKVTYTVDSSSAVWKNINLCEVDRITIRYNRSTDTTSATFD